jgi:hypothetical protein
MVLLECAILTIVLDSHMMYQKDKRCEMVKDKREGIA